MTARDRVLVTHGGTLVPQRALLELQTARYVQRMNGRPLSDTIAYRSILRQAVVDIVAQQRDTGIDIVSDGALGNPSWRDYHHDRIGGTITRPFHRPTRMSMSGADRSEFSDFYREYDQATYGMQLDIVSTGRRFCVAPIEYTGHDAVASCIEDFREACDLAGVSRGFMTAIAPASASFGIENEYYEHDSDLIFAMARALNVEYRAIIDAGFDVQLDDAMLTFMFEAMVPPASLAEYRAWVELMVEATKVSLENIPPTRVRYHICWGSWNGPHMFDIPLAEVIDLILQIPAAGISFASANPRHEHEWSIWADIDLPPGKILIPGVVDPLTNFVEHPDLVAERIVRFADLVGVENLLASTDCGFAPWLTPTTHETVMWAKLESLVEGARRASRLLATTGAGRLG